MSCVYLHAEKVGFEYFRLTEDREKNRILQVKSEVYSNFGNDENKNNALANTLRVISEFKLSSNAVSFKLKCRQHYLVIHLITDKQLNKSSLNPI